MAELKRGNRVTYAQQKRRRSAIVTAVFVDGHIMIRTEDDYREHFVTSQDVAPVPPPSVPFLRSKAPSPTTQRPV